MTSFNFSSILARIFFENYHKVNKSIFLSVLWRLINQSIASNFVEIYGNRLTGLAFDSNLQLIFANLKADFVISFLVLNPSDSNSTGKYNC